jgi:hypothetical protein
VAIVQPRLIGIDTSVLGDWAAAAFSPDGDARRRAKDALSTLLASDWIPLVSWHHFEELLCHAEEKVVANRIAFIRSLRHISWVKSPAGRGHLGSIVDLLEAEIRAALSALEGDAPEYREKVRASIVHFGAPDELETLELWREVRPLLQARQERSRQVASIAHTEVQELQPRVLELTKMQALDDQSALSLFRNQAAALARQLAERGDRRLQEATHVASAFQEDVFQAFRKMRDSGAAPLEAFLREFDVPPEDITEDMNLEAFAEIAEKRKRLRVVCDGSGLDLDRVWPRLRYAKIPSLWVQEEIRRARKSAPRASGSDLNDSHLAAFAPYLNAVVVDRRTHEYLSQGCRRTASFRTVVGRFLRVSSYEELAAAL